MQYKEAIDEYIEKVFNERFEFIIESSFLPIVTNTRRHLMLPISIADDTVDVKEVVEKLRENFHLFSLSGCTINISETIKYIDLTSKIVSLFRNKKPQGNILIFKNKRRSIRFNPDSSNSITSTVFRRCRGFNINDEIEVDYICSDNSFYLASKYFDKIYCKYSDFINNNGVLYIMGYPTFGLALQGFLIYQGDYPIDEFGITKMISDAIGNSQISDIDFKSSEDCMKFANSALNFVPNRNENYNVNFVSQGERDVFENLSHYQLFDTILDIYLGNLGYDYIESIELVKKKNRI